MIDNGYLIWIIGIIMWYYLQIIINMILNLTDLLLNGGIYGYFAKGKLVRTIGNFVVIILWNNIGI